jgi:hypothetical protein
MMMFRGAGNVSVVQQQQSSKCGNGPQLVAEEEAEEGGRASGKETRLFARFCL